MWQDETGHAGDNCVFVNVTAADTDAMLAELAGDWVEPGTFNGRNNTMTVRDDGSFVLEYAAGGTRVGRVDVLPEEHPDGTLTYRFAFCDEDGSLWESFAVPDEKPFDDIYSGQDGDMHFVRVTND